MLHVNHKNSHRFPLEIIFLGFMRKSWWKLLLKKSHLGDFLAIQWLGLSAFTADSMSSIPGEGTKISKGVQLGKTNKTNFTIRIHITYQLKMLYLLPLPSVSAFSHVGAAGGNRGCHLSHLKTYEYFLEKKEKYLACNMAHTSSLPFPRSMLPTRLFEGRVLSHITQ